MEVEPAINKHKIDQMRMFTLRSVALALWLVHMTLDGEVQAQSLAGVLSCVRGQDKLLSVSLFTQV